MSAISGNNSTLTSIAAAEGNLKGVFDTPTPKLFWHYVAKNCKKDSNYNPQIIAKRIEGIIATLKENSFQIKDVNGWTPLHVAVISNNPIAVEFLIGHGADTEITDDFGRKPLDYASPTHSAAISQMISAPHQFFSNPIEAGLKAVFAKWNVQLPQMTGPYRENTDDFGRKITQLFVGSKDGDSSELTKVEDVIEEILHVSKRLGISFNLSKSLPHVRDHWIRHQTGVLLKPMQSSQHELAVDRARSHACYFNTGAPTLTDNFSFRNATSGMSMENAAFFGGLEKELGLKEAVAEANFDFEGGNAIKMTNSKGKVKFLLGSIHQLVTLNQHRLNPSLAEKMKQEIDSKMQLDKKEIRAIAEEMYAQGLLKVSGNTGFIAAEKTAEVNYKQMQKGFTHSSDPHNHDFRKTAVKLGVFKPFVWSEEIEKEVRELVTKYVQQKLLVQKETAKSLGVSTEDVIYLPEAAYHLDMFLKPGPNGMFVQDYGFCLDVLEAIKAKATELKLTKNDKIQLDNYIASAKKFRSEFGPLLDNVKNILAKADIPVIPMPGWFIDNSKKMNGGDITVQTQSSNFINALSGFSDKTNKYFYITTGCKVGDRLGDVVMDTFHAFLNHYVPGIEVYFVGRNPKNYRDFTPAMQIVNSPLSTAGVHCLTFELQTANHDTAGTNTAAAPAASGAAAPAASGAVKAGEGTASAGKAAALPPTPIATATPPGLNSMSI